MSGSEPQLPARPCGACRGTGKAGRDVWGNRNPCGPCNGTGVIEPENDLTGPAWARCPLGCGSKRVFKRLYACGTTVMGDLPDHNIIDRGKHCDGETLSTREALRK